MSALGQKSALPPKADIHCDGRNVRFGPEAEATRFHIVVPESGHSALIENITCPPQQVRQRSPYALYAHTSDGEASCH
jgi:hypothetical protein